MFCSTCGCKNDDSAAFCNKCGTPLQTPSTIQTAEKTLTQTNRIKSGAWLTLIGAGIGVLVTLLGLFNMLTIESTPTGRIIHLLLFVFAIVANVVIMNKKNMLLSKVLSVAVIFAALGTLLFWILYGLAGLASLNPGMMCLYSPFLTVAEIIFVVGTIKTCIAVFAYAEN
jgi:hypothetical protein